MLIHVLFVQSLLFWDAGLVCEQPLFTTDWDWLFVRPGYCVVNLPLLIITLLRFLIKNHLVLSVNLRWTCVNGYIHNCIKQLLKNYYRHEQFVTPRIGLK